MKTCGDKDMIYQIRPAAGRSLDDVVTALTQSIWKIVAQPGNPDLRAHQWPRLFAGLANIFKKRTLCYAECGSLQECRFATSLLGAPEPGASWTGPTYLLTLKGGLLHFVETLTAVVWRRLRRAGRIGGREERARIQNAIYGALAPYLYYSESCSTCLRASLPERRVWSAERAGSPWGV